MATQFLNPMILVKKGGKLPEGHIQSWFWERGNLKDSLPLKLPAGAPPSAWEDTYEVLSARLLDATNRHTGHKTRFWLFCFHATTGLSCS